jgi:hypothetical protein
MSSIPLADYTPTFNISEFDIFHRVEKNPQGPYPMVTVSYRATKVPLPYFGGHYVGHPRHWLKKLENDFHNGCFDRTDCSQEASWVGSEIARPTPRL